MPLGIDPLVDYVFKRLFGDPANSDLLIHLLNAVLQFTSPIVEVKILNPFNEKEFADDKLTVLDIKARCGDGGTTLKFSDDGNLRSVPDWHTIAPN